MVKLRNEVAEQDKWNVAALYPDLTSWEVDFEKTKGNKEFPHWPQLQTLRGTLKQGPKQVLKALDAILPLRRHLEKLYTYAHLRNDEDITHDRHKSAYKQISNLLHDFGRESAWFEPELLELSDAQLAAYVNSSELAPYRFFMEKIIRLKPHTLPPDQEVLLAMAGRALQTPHKAFSALNDADFRFGKVLDSKGQERELTHASYALFIRDRDRTLRKNSFQALHGKFREYEQTLCELLSGQMESHLFEARAKKYATCLDAALFPKNIDPSVYHSLIQAVRKNLHALHDYMQLRKQIMGLEELHLYDVYVPLTQKLEIKVPYQEAENLVIESVAPLGAEYQEFLRAGMQKQRWVDRFENRNKRSGAYSSGCYDSNPYILMNFKELARDVSTLAHEAGHSMHSLYSRKTQPYHYADYPIFVAEVASTFNEELLHDLLLERLKSDEERLFLITEKLEDLRGTLFRQTMFAEFELFVHTAVENHTPLTPQMLKEQYAELNRAYFGPGVVIDEEIQSEWSRIPHFYYNFYVYQYATGISAAIALADRVKKMGEPARKAYLTFLSGGCSRFPIDLLQTAGVDMKSPAPVEQAIGKFQALVRELRRLVASSRLSPCSPIRDR